MTHRLGIFLALACGCWAQATDTVGPEFDAAAIHEAPPMGPGSRMGMSGGPGSSDPGLFRCENCTISMLVCKAFELHAFEVVVPVSATELHFSIEARLPRDASSDQFRFMLQNLLKERFHLTFHRATESRTAYILKVSKSGPTLQKSEDANRQGGEPSEQRQDRPPELRLDRDGLPILPPGRGFMLASMNGHYRLRATECTLSEFAIRLSNQLDAPVIDRTGLHGNFDISLTWSADEGRTGATSLVDATGGPAPLETGETLFSALRSQLGLQAETGKAPIQVFVVDHVAHTPEAN